MLSKKIIIRIENSGNVSAECKLLGISRSSYYRDQEKRNSNNLRLKSRKPRKTSKTLRSTEKEIVKLAKSGKYRHASEVTKEALKRGIEISDNNVIRILCEHGLYGRYIDNNGINKIPRKGIFPWQRR